MLRREKCNKTLPKYFFPSCTVFQVKGVERGQKMPSFPMSFPDDNLSIPCLIETKLIQMEGIGKGKITIDFGVSRSKVKVTISKNRIY